MYMCGIQLLRSHSLFCTLHKCSWGSSHAPGSRSHRRMPPHAAATVRIIPACRLTRSPCGTIRSGILSWHHNRGLTRSLARTQKPWPIQGKSALLALCCAANLQWATSSREAFCQRSQVCRSNGANKEGLMPGSLPYQGAAVRGELIVPL
jgi:hypothetical protein